MNIKNKDLAMLNKVEKTDVQHDLNKENNKPESKKNAGNSVLENK